MLKIFRSVIESNAPAAVFPILRVERRASGSVIERLEGATLASFMEDEVRAGLLQAVSEP